MRDRDELDEAIRATRNLGISAKQAEEAREEQLRQLKAHIATMPEMETEAAFWRGKCDETQKLLDRALAQVAERDAQLRSQELTVSHLHGQVAALERVFAMGQSAGIDTKSLCGYEWDDDGPCDHACGVVNPLHLGDHVCEQGCGAMCSQQRAERIEETKHISHLHGQVAALKDVFAMGQQAVAQALYGPQVTHAVAQEFELQGLDDVPPRREEPALAGVQQRVTEQLKSAGIDTKSICHYEWDDDDNVCGKHACGMVNPLHLGDHACERECGATCSQQEAERIEEAKQRADSDG